MRIRLVLYGSVLCSLLFLIEHGRSTILTTTLLTGFMGGYLIGKTTLATFLTLLAATNRTSLPALPTINLPSFPTLIPRTEDAVKSANNISPSAPVVYLPAAAVQPNAGIPVKAASPATVGKLSITPVDVPISLDNKVRDRFIRQLALMDPLNCLPKIFCEVSADPYGTALAMDYGTVAAVHPIQQPQITKEELVAYENTLIKTQSTTPAGEGVGESVNDDAAEDKSESDEDDLSASNEGDSDEDSFEDFKRAEEHQMEMQALDEMVDEIEDPMSYYYILRDKQDSKKKRKKKKKKNKEPFFSDFRQGLIDPSDMMPSYNPIYANRRMGMNPMPPTPPVMLPPRMPSRHSEGSIDDMFADDPFFSGFDSRSKRTLSKSNNFRRVRQIEARPENVESESVMKNYRVAFLVAEKYKSPSMCGVAFPTCPYQTKTILSVVNRLQSGVIPGGSTDNGKNDNIVHFRNTLLAIERLNKAALQAKKNGESFNVQKMTEVVLNPKTNLDSTSQKIVNEFRQVVAQIGKKKRRKKTKQKSKGHKRRYDVVHYYKKAHIEFQPRQRVKTVESKRKTGHGQDDENIPVWERVPTFNQTYFDMFTTTKPKSKMKNRPKSSSKRHGQSTKNVTTKSTTTVKPKIVQVLSEDDEMDAKDSEDAINAMISKLPHRSLL